MKYFTIFCFCFFISYSSHLNAQVPNTGFEDWDSNGEPVGWYTNNAPGVFTTITKSSDAHSGSWTMEGNVDSVSGLTVGPAIIVGEEGEGIPINFRPASLKGYNKFNSVNNDYMQVQANFFKDSVEMGVGAANLNPAGTYRADFSGVDLASGLYIAKLQAGNYSRTIKMSLLKQ